MEGTIELELFVRGGPEIRDAFYGLSQSLDSATCQTVSVSYRTRGHQLTCADNETAIRKAFRAIRVCCDQCGFRFEGKLDVDSHHMAEWRSKLRSDGSWVKVLALRGNSL